MRRSVARRMTIATRTQGIGMDPPDNLHNQSGMVCVLLVFVIIQIFKMESIFNQIILMFNRIPALQANISWLLLCPASKYQKTQRQLTVLVNQLYLVAMKPINKKWSQIFHMLNLLCWMKKYLVQDG